MSAFNLFVRCALRVVIAMQKYSETNTRKCLILFTSPKCKIPSIIHFSFCFIFPLFLLQKNTVNAWKGKNHVTRLYSQEMPITMCLSRGSIDKIFWNSREYGFFVPGFYLKHFDGTCARDVAERISMKYIFRSSARCETNSLANGRSVASSIIGCVCIVLTVYLNVCCVNTNHNEKITYSNIDRKQTWNQRYPKMCDAFKSQLFGWNRHQPLQVANQIKDKRWECRNELPCCVAFVPFI